MSSSLPSRLRGGSGMVSEPSTVMVIRPPLWFRMLYVGLSIACLLFVVVAAFAFDRTTAVDFGFPVLLIAAFAGLVAVMSLRRRLELRGDRLYSVQVMGTKQVAVNDIGSMRVSQRGSGLSRVEFVRRDGNAAFGKTRGTWPTTDLMQLAQAMNVSVEAP